jgi:hypothetical protein
MYPNLNHFLVPPYLSCILMTFLLKKTKPKKSSHHGSCSMSQCVTEYKEMFVGMSYWSGSRPLASATLSVLDPHWESSQISCCCLVSWRSCSFNSSGTAPSQAPDVHRWDRYWSGPTLSPGSGPGWKLSWSACQLSYTVQPGPHSHFAQARGRASTPVYGSCRG